MFDFVALLKESIYKILHELLFNINFYKISFRILYLVRLPHQRTCDCCLVHFLMVSCMLLFE